MQIAAWLLFRLCAVKPLKMCLFSPTKCKSTSGYDLVQDPLWPLKVALFELLLKENQSTKPLSIKVFYLINYKFRNMALTKREPLPCRELPCVTERLSLKQFFFILHCINRYIEKRLSNTSWVVEMGKNFFVFKHTVAWHVDVKPHIIVLHGLQPY